MGTEQLQKLIDQLEEQVEKKNSDFQQFLSWFWFGKRAIQTKQLKILKAVNEELHKNSAVKPAEELNKKLRSTNETVLQWAIVECLARLRTWRQLKTNFISWKDRWLTEQERNDLLLQLRRAAIVWAQTHDDITVPQLGDNELKWDMFWKEFLDDTVIQTEYDDTVAMLGDSYQNMQTKINKWRKRMAFRDMWTNAATMAAIWWIWSWIFSWFSTGPYVDGVPDSSTSLGHQYDLWSYDHTEASDLFDGDLAETVDAGDTISIEWESWVDAVSAVSWEFGDLQEELSAFQDYVSDNFSDAWSVNTINTWLQHAIEDVYQAWMSAWADPNNILLAQQRLIDGTESLMEQLHEATGWDVLISSYGVDFDVSWIEIEQSVSPWTWTWVENAANRAVWFNVVVDGTPWYREQGDPIRVVWPGFSNTYADASSKKRKMNDSWSKK